MRGAPQRPPEDACSPWTSRPQQWNPPSPAPHTPSPAARSPIASPVFNPWQLEECGWCVPILQARQLRLAERRESPKVRSQLGSRDSTTRFQVSLSLDQDSRQCSLPFPSPREVWPGAHWALLQPRDAS